MEGLYNGLIFLGIVQGLIFAFVVFTSKRHASRNSFYLGMLVLVLSLGSLQFSLEEMGVISDDFLYDVLHIPWSVLMPPFLLFFGITFLNPQAKITRKQKFLYLPFVGAFLISTIYKILVAFGSQDPEFTEKLYEIPDIGDIYGDLLTGIFLLVVIIALYKKIIRYEKSHSTFQVKEVKIRLNWLKATLLLLVLLILLSTTYIIKYYFDEETNFYPFYLALAFVIYWLGHAGVHKYCIVEERKNIRKHKEERHSYSISEIQKNEHIEALENILINEKRFLDSTISLETIANELKISKGHLSRVINSELNNSFSDYVNLLRVEEAKSYLLNPEFSNYTLVAMGLEAGFNSKSTFNSAFKKVTGLTPSQFKKTHLN